MSTLHHTTAINLLLQNRYFLFLQLIMQKDTQHTSHNKTLWNLHRLPDNKLQNHLLHGNALDITASYGLRLHTFMSKKICRNITSTVEFIPMHTYVTCQLMYMHVTCKLITFTVYHFSSARCHRSCNTVSTVYINTACHQWISTPSSSSSVVSSYIGWSDVTVIYGHITTSMLWGNTAYRVKLSGRDLQGRIKRGRIQMHLYPKIVMHCTSKRQNKCDQFSAGKIHNLSYINLLQNQNSGDVSHCVA